LGNLNDRPGSRSIDISFPCREIAAGELGAVPIVRRRKPARV
jgi:hypothetical protein